MAARAPTVQDIVQDPLTQLSLTYWAPSAGKARKPYDPKVTIGRGCALQQC